MGEGRGDDASVGGGVPWMARVANEAMSSEMLLLTMGVPWREWWAGFGTVGEALVGWWEAGFEMVLGG